MHDAREQTRSLGPRNGGYIIMIMCLWKITDRELSVGSRAKDFFGGEAGITARPRACRADRVEHSKD